MKNNETPQCKDCGTTENLKFEPCPYAEEICDDDTPVWMCVACRYSAAMDI